MAHPSNAGVSVVRQLTHDEHSPRTQEGTKPRAP
nr:MAG TPA: hypothetical protein [Caudoviricetes sp.]